jgi:NADP-dependent 3-hydroxy acid dehydrogenase YdfG
VSGLFAGRAVVVTGVTSGIGEALVTRLLAEGAEVAGLGRDADKLAAAATRWGARFIAVQADLADRGQRQRALAQLRERVPRVEVLVNNAAEIVYATPLGLETARWAALLEVNLLAAIDLVSGLAAHLGPGAQVVNVSSVTARQMPGAKFCPYALTKAALERFTEGLRMELAPRGVKVSLIVPGLVDTPVYDRVEGFDAARKALRSQVPEWLTADDVADAMMWMLTRPPRVLISEITLVPRGQAR